MRPRRPPKGSGARAPGQLLQAGPGAHVRSAALAWSENGRSGAFERFTLALEHEINEGRFYLEPMVNGDVVCVTPTIGLRLVNDEGQVLLQLGKWSSSRVHVHGRLPSIVRRPEERLVDAFGRLTEGKLAPFMGQFEETFTEEVDKLGRDIHATFRTRYLQVIQHACLSGSEWQQRMRRMSNSAAGGADPSVPASLSPAAGRRGELTRMSTSTSDFCDASQALRESPSRGNGRKLTIGQGSSSSGAITSSGAIASSSTRGSICRDARSSRGAIGRDISTMESGGSWASASQNVGGLARLLTRLSGRATALGGVGHAERQHETAGRPDMYAHRHEECIYVFAFVPEDLAEAICRGEDHADEIVSLWMNGVALDERPSDAFDGALSSPSASRPAGANSATASSGASHTQASEPLSPGLRVGSPSGSSRASPSGLASAASRAAAQDDGARWRLSSATSELRLTFASEDSDKGSEGSRVCI
ncbi:unnamed protein product [Prorocentrum cordatum]|uniref:Uncharacterized protein n=1 Tax=Prorocentrum cordatum TaxID=2364126 RepID=A0ABN9VAK6_9DINO|nr:unnamed protein product [Polarella glacialis]